MSRQITVQEMEASRSRERDEEDVRLHREHSRHRRQGTHSRKENRSRAQTLQKNNVSEEDYEPETFMVQLHVQTRATSRSSRILLGMESSI